MFYKDKIFEDANNWVKEASAGQPRCALVAANTLVSVDDDGREYVGSCGFFGEEEDIVAAVKILLRNEQVGHVVRRAVTEFIDETGFTIKPKERTGINTVVKSKKILS